jgi:hypothetical protein
MSSPTSHFRLFALVCGFLALAGGAYGVWELENRSVGDPWTPAVYAPGLEATADRIEVLVGGTPLAKVLGEQRLTMTTPAGPAPVQLADVRVRMNNELSLRAASVRPMLAFAALAGAGLVLFVIGLLTPMIGAFRQHGLIDPHLV